MKKSGKSKFDQTVIELVKSVRLREGYTQKDVAVVINVQPGYIGQIESPNTKAKYNLNHLNSLSVEWNISPREFLPQKVIEEKVVSGRLKKKKECLFPK